MRWRAGSVGPQPTVAACLRLRRRRRLHLLLRRRRVRRRRRDPSEHGVPCSRRLIGVPRGLAIRCYRRLHRIEPSRLPRRGARRRGGSERRAAARRRDGAGAVLTAAGYRSWASSPTRMRVRRCGGAVIACDIISFGVDPKRDSVHTHKPPPDAGSMAPRAACQQHVDCSPTFDTYAVARGKQGTTEFTLPHGGVRRPDVFVTSDGEEPTAQHYNWHAQHRAATPFIDVTTWGARMAYRIGVRRESGGGIAHRRHRQRDGIGGWRAARAHARRRRMPTCLCSTCRRRPCR